MRVPDVLPLPPALSDITAVKLIQIRTVDGKMILTGPPSC